MRLLVASGIFYPEPGGPATYLHRLLPALQARGFDITALSFGDSPADAYPYPLTRIPRRFYPLRQWDYFRAAARLWPHHDLAYIHSLGLPLPASIRPRVAKIVGDPAWERAVNKGWIPPTTDIDAFQTASSGPRANFNRWLRSREARRLDHIIVPSQYLQQMVVGWGVDPDRITVVYNALDQPEEVAVTQEEARTALDLPAGPLLFTAARLTAWKGIDHVLRALVNLADVRYVVAGDGPMWNELHALADRLRISDRVTFLGRVPRTDMPTLFRAADYTLLYSGYEGLSHVLLESLSMGTPVIASHKGGNPEVVTHDTNGLLVPYIDADALRSAIEAAFQPGARDRLASNTHRGLDRFSFDTMLDQTIAVLNRFV